MTLQIITLNGTEAKKYIQDLARLRITVFRDFPYLYDGDYNYEEKYLNTYFSCPDSFVAICLNNNTPIGASTALPLKEEEENFIRPFLDRELPIDEICYYGESVLLKEFRGKGIGKTFMMEREKYARSKGFKFVTFCAVVRKNPPNFYRPLDSFWATMGFEKIPGLIATYYWKDLNEVQQSAKQMQFWMKKL